MCEKCKAYFAGHVWEGSLQGKRSGRVFLFMSSEENPTLIVTNAIPLLVGAIKGEMRYTIPVCFEFTDLPTSPVQIDERYSVHELRNLSVGDIAVFNGLYFA